MATIALVGVWASVAAAQEVVLAASSADDPVAAVTTPVVARAVLGAGDTIRIASLTSEELTKEWRIGETGRLHLPLIGGVDVAGMTVAELQQRLNKRYKEFIKEPMIDVFLVDIQSRPVSVYGLVDEPGAYQLRGPTSLARLIQEAGGVTEGAFSVTLIRHTDWGIDGLPKPKLLAGGKVRVDLEVENVLQGYGPAADIPVRPYDMIRVEARPQRLIIIAGEVNNPGAVQLDTVDGIRLSRALATAGGYKSSAGHAHALLWREGQQAETATEIHLRDVIRGRAEDVMLREGDYLIVPPKHGFVPTMQALSAIIHPITTTLLVLQRY